MDHDHDLASESPAGASSPGDRDLLSDVLETVRLRGAVFFVWEPAWPYATSIPDGRQFAALIMPGAEQIASYHVVVEGPCWGAVEGADPVRLETGDVLLIPRGDAYVIASEPCPPDRSGAEQSKAFFRAMAAGELPAVVRDGGPGPASNRLVCGFLGCDLRPFNPLLGALPRMLRLPAPAQGADPLAALLDFAIDQTRQPATGQRCVLLRLSELMFVEVIRRHLNAGSPTHGGWLQALHDPVVSRALARMHERPAQAWTLDSLARAAGVSRSVLAERFAHLLGEPPIQYLARWRMQLAARALIDSRQKVYAVAREVGYRSEAAFSRAFKRIVGSAPADWRRSRLSATADWRR